MSFCNNCEKNKTVLRCGHRCCSHKLRSYLYEHKVGVYKCLDDKCTSELFDFEIRKVLSLCEYKVFQDKMLNNKEIPVPNCGWVCNFCTFINLPYSEYCNVCQSNRPGDYRPPLYYRHTKGEPNKKSSDLPQNKDGKERDKTEKGNEIAKKLEKSTKQGCGWPCNFCTFVNLPYLKFCVVCQSNRPVDYLPPNNYKKSQQEEDALSLEDQHLKDEDERMERDKAEMKNSLELLKELTKQEVALTTEVSECPICMGEYQPGEAIILHSCLHTICRDCFKNYLLNTGESKIKCPTENCIGLIEDREIIAMLSPSDFEKYQQLSLRTAEATAEFSFHCKGINCTAWIVHDEWLKSFKCPLCKKENCIKCAAIHEGSDCQSYKRNLKNENISADALYFENLLKNDEAMICSGCKIIIEKVKGCDWIRCRMCQTELCWATKGPRWGPKGYGDISGGCRCKVDNKKCHPLCHYCH